jgi:hypothetical protein
VTILSGGILDRFTARHAAVDACDVISDLTPRIAPAMTYKTLTYTPGNLLDSLSFSPHRVSQMSHIALQPQANVSLSLPDTQLWTLAMSYPTSLPG